MTFNEKCREYFVKKDTYRDFCPHCIEVAGDLIDEAIKLERKRDKIWKKIYKLVGWNSD